MEQGQVTGTPLAIMLGVKRTIIYRWKKELATHGPDISFPDKGRARTDEQTESQRLKREFEQVTQERDILKKKRRRTLRGNCREVRLCASLSSSSSRWPGCNALRVSRSGYYDWLGRTPCERVQEDASLLVAIERTHHANRQAYGADKTWCALNARGIACGKHRVARLRRQARIEALRKQRFRRLDKHSLLGPAPNRLRRQFTVQCPNKVWVEDITVVPTRAVWLYAVLLNLYSRSVVGWSMAEKADRNLLIGALQMALARRNPGQGLMQHSDRGAQYSSSEYRGLLAEHDIARSMSAKGDPYDKAVAESFFSNLKNELTHHLVFHSREHDRKRRVLRGVGKAHKCRRFTERQAGRIAHKQRRHRPNKRADICRLPKC